ncbi:nucleolar transcription factor 1-A [Tetranychus urticae]|uniref:HMG box domain-containing protein n=1 Tax=Tetranychus urticae TaxID=32264 RepID=T1KZK0_TETUR|nr:nucleolar transcription factor 1-A [Tetranychus urticae]
MKVNTYGMSKSSSKSVNIPSLDDSDSIVAPIAQILLAAEDHVASSVPVEEAAEEVVAKLIWPSEDIQLLIENIHKCLPKNDTAKYSTTAKKLSWDDIKFKDYSADECKSQWDLVLTRIRRYRTLSEVLGDARDWAKNPYNNASLNKKTRHPDLPKKPLTPFLRYFTEKRERFAKKNPNSTSVVDMAKALAAQYRDLSEKKKAKYKTAFDREYEEYKRKMEEFKKLHPEIEINPHNKKEPTQAYPGPVRPKTPFQIFCRKKTAEKIDSKEVEDGEFSKKDNLEQMRKAWHDLSDKKRLKWIKKSLADEKRYIEELSEFKKANPDYEPPVIKVLNKMEKDLKQRYDGKPERPPSSGYALFSKVELKGIKDCPAKEKMTLIAHKWKELSQDEKNRYNQEACKKQREYSDKMETYLASLPEDEKEQFMAEEKYKLPGDKAKKSPSKSKEKDIKDLPVEELAKDANISAAAQCYFQAERLVALQAKNQNKSQSELTGKIIEEWSKMPLDKKEKYFRMVEGMSLTKKPTGVKKTKLTDRYEGLEPAEVEIVTALLKKMPKPPPKNAYSIFLTEKLAQLSNFEPKKRMAEVSRLWRSVLTESEKQRYENKVKEFSSLYENQLQTFVKSLNSKEKTLYERHLKKNETSSNLKRSRNNDNANSKKAKLEQQQSSDDEEMETIKQDDNDSDNENSEEDDDDDEVDEDEVEEDEADEDEVDEDEDDDSDSDESENDRSSDDENKEPVRKPKSKR